VYILRANEGLVDEVKLGKELGDTRRAAERTLVREQHSSKDQQRQFFKFNEYKDTSKVARKTSGSPAQPISIGEHKRIPKFDDANLEVSKGYHNFLIFLLFALVVLPCYVIADELRIGLLAHDLGAGFKQRYEKGIDAQLEYIAGESYSFLLAKPHVGATINTGGGYTQTLYAGLTWRAELVHNFFIEASLGGGAHNGNLNTESRKKSALGSRFLFRESFSFGNQFSENYNLSVIVDHM
jgi:hypothetical protein